MSLSRHYRTALVTGASAGLGAAFTQMLLDAGLQVWGTARAVERLARWREHPSFHPLVLDLHEADAAADAYRAVETAAGGVDILINNAGYGVFARFEEEPWPTWEQQVQAMLLQPMRLLHLALPRWRERGSGAAVNVASLAVEFPLPYLTGYNVVKAGLAACSESLLIETAGTNISVIDFRPGDYRTDFNRSMLSTGLHRSGSPDPRLQRVWQTLEQNLARAPHADQAARDLRRLLERGYRGTFRSGSFFQARVAPLSAALSQSLRRTLHWRYFDVR